jgi:hypothetical protein
MALGGYFSAPDFSAFGGSAALDTFCKRVNHLP